MDDASSKKRLKRDRERLNTNGNVVKHKELCEKVSVIIKGDKRMLSLQN